MENYLTLEEIEEKCDQLKDVYEIDDEKFYHIVEKWSEEEVTLEEKLISSFSELLQLVSEEITSMEESVQMQPTCRMGCAFCCYFPIVINGMEAKLMQKAIANLPKERRNTISDHLTRYYEKHGEKLDQITALDIDGDEDFKFKYRKSLVPCPLLNTETNQCMAYEIRPIPCRTYMNYTDPKVCEENLMPKETISFEFLYQEYMGALNEFLQFLYEEGDTAFIEYPNDVYAHDYLANWLR